MRSVSKICVLSFAVSYLCVMVLTGCGQSNSSSPENTGSESDTVPTNESEQTDGEGNTPDSETTDTSSSGRPNVLLVISDDQGLDVSAQYNFSNDLPDTPTINALAASGIVYDNAWATPSCTTTRAATLTGLHGVNNGVPQTPGFLSPTVGTIQSYLADDPLSANYATGVFGKWHVAGINPDLNHPASLGVDHYAGNLTGNLSDYFEWPMVVNGVASTNSKYHTSAITDMAIDWIGQQSTPWFAWVAYSAPHTPFHAPPEEFNSRGLSRADADIDANRREYFLSAIETLDTELGRLLDSLDADERNRTLVIYMGDNGTPRSVIDAGAFGARSHSKNTLFEGGVRVPLVISGNGVTRTNEREAGLVHVVDFFPTIAQLLSDEVVSDRDGYSLVPSFSSTSAVTRDYNYTEFISDNTRGHGWTVRNNDFKYIAYNDGSEALYSLVGDVSESVNMIGSNQSVVDELKEFGLSVRDETNDSTANSDAIDITDTTLTRTIANCSAYAELYTAMATDAATGTAYTAAIDVATNATHCVFNSNAIPNHTFNDGASAFPNPVSEQSTEYLVPLNPTFAAGTTPLSLRYDDAVLLNGVKIDLLAAGCFGVGDGRIGCNDDAQPWRYDPMYSANGFRVDQHNAHTQPDGAYHYHGNPNALFADQGGVESPVIGFAADGFPIYGSYFNDNGVLRKAQSSYQLKQGLRPAGADSPQGQYDGAFRDDYEFVEGTGDLDDCNGMWVNDSYGYYVTDVYPHVMACFKGTVDESFRK